MHCLSILSSQAHSVSKASAIVEKYGEEIYRHSDAVGMVMVVINKGKVSYSGYGETRPGNRIKPTRYSFIRIASITKVMTSEILVKLASEGKLNLADPLYKYIPQGQKVPNLAIFNPIRLYQLAAHTSGLPREQPGRPQKATVFTWPTKAERWNWVRRTPLLQAQEQQVSYSNLAYDLLADALAQAVGKPYPELFREKITTPLGMKDTTYTPLEGQCKRLMVAARGSGPCKNGLAAIGSGGVYSTPNDIALWMERLLKKRQNGGAILNQEKLRLYYSREEFTFLKGMDVAGQAEGIGLGWIYMRPQNSQLGILQKTGGGGGFLTYMVLVPEKQLGVFVVLTRGKHTRFKNMSNGVNKLVTELAKRKTP